MPQLVFPIGDDGPCVEVFVNLNETTLRPLRAAGGGPSPIPGRGLIDTGTDITSVALPILQQLGVPVTRRRSTQTVGGNIEVDLYEVSLHILHFANPTGPWLTQPALLVMALPTPLVVDVLIGMDLLLGCRMFLDGPAKQFTLDF